MSTRTSWAVRVDGLPAPQGSKKHVGNGVMVESSKRVKPWRAAVEKAARAAIADEPSFVPFAGAVCVTATYVFPRPKAHYGTGRNAGVLKASAPDVVTTLPDVEKVVRSTHDALTTAGVWNDDRLVVSVFAIKVYGDRPGADIEIEPYA